jgi:hypothetical protein
VAVRIPEASVVFQSAYHVQIRAVGKSATGEVVTAGPTATHTLTALGDDAATFESDEAAGVASPPIPAPYEPVYQPRVIPRKRVKPHPPSSPPTIVTAV